MITLLAGLACGLVVSRRWRPLLAEHWRALFLLLPAIVVSSLPFFLYTYKPEWIGTDDRRLLLSLILLRFLLFCLLLLLNLLPARWFSAHPGSGLTILQKICLLPLLLGLAGETAVLLLNQGYWPVAEAILTENANPAFAAGVRNDAYVFLRVIDNETYLPWLGQIWPCPWPASWRLAALPAISPAEVLSAAGLFLIGISQFFPAGLASPLEGKQPET